MTIDKLAHYSHDDWKATAERELGAVETRLWIDGAFTAAAGGRFDSINPATGDSIASVALADAADVDRAVAAARRAFDDGRWTGLAPRQRMAILYRFAELIDAHAERLAVLDTLDMGKPISDMLEVDLPLCRDTIRFMAEYVDKMEGSVTNTERDVMHLVLREPLGVVGAISPWNYPLLMAVWKIAPALAAGNTVVLKPAEQAPLSCLRLAELFSEAGGPDGVLNVINGPGEVTGKALALHADVDKITFTGSTATGKLIMQYAGQSNLKKVGLECGGKSPQLFLGDLPDLDRAVSAAINGIYANMGEVCNAGSRLLVDRAIHDDFVNRFIEQGRQAYTPGDPLDPATNFGPLVTAADQQRVLGMIDGGRQAGAKLEFGGDAPDGPGAYVNPTLFTGVTNDMQIAREEIFGPVAAIIPFDGPDEAVRIANDTIYGLAASVWTRDLDRAMRLVRDVKAGIIWVNTFDEGDMTQPFGGYKQSGNARDKCIDSILSYTQTKSAWFRLT